MVYQTFVIAAVALSNVSLAAVALPGVSDNGRRPSENGVALSGANDSRYSPIKG